MKFRLEWIASYLGSPLPELAELSRRLTAVGFIVEGTEGAGTSATLEVELTANRPDAMSHRGLAREAALALGRRFADPVEGRALPEGDTPAAQLASVTIEEPSLCSRYSARVLTGVEVRPASPAVAERLAAIGLNPISAPVDATNHVLWDIGQPLHAFDLDKLARGSDGRPAIVVRRAREGERLVTLDGVERTLSGEHLVIADAQRPVALAGVMGGLETAIGPSTRNVLLESAHFHPPAVRRTARAFGMHTDASHRFERGCDPSSTLSGLDRAARLIAADCGGTVARGVVDVVARRIDPRTVSLALPFVGRFLGMEVPLARILEVFAALGFETVRDGDLLRVSVPTARVDLELPADLVEEVIRHVGYDALPETLPPPFNPSFVEPLLEREERARDVLAGAGLSEAQTYSFVSADENAPFAQAAPGSAATVENALGEPFTTMRATPVVGLLRSARHNVRRGARDVALFEVGRSFGMEGGQPRESRRAAALLHGRRGRHWSAEAPAFDLFDGTGLATLLFRELGAPDPRFVPSDLPFLSPGRSARVVSAEGADAGWAGVLAPRLASGWDLTDPVVVDVDLEAIVPSARPATVEPPSRFPGSEVDLTVTHAASRPFAELSGAARAGAPAELLDVDVKYRYTGPGVAAGQVKTTLTLTFGSAARSLAREEVNAWRDAAARRLLALGDTRVDGVE